MFGLSTEVITNGKLATLKDLIADVLIALCQSKISALKSLYGGQFTLSYQQTIKIKVVFLNLILLVINSVDKSNICLDSLC